MSYISYNSDLHSEKPSNKESNSSQTGLNVKPWGPQRDMREKEKEKSKLIKC